MDGVLFTTREKAQYIDEYSAGIRNFYTFKGSGKEFMRKKTLKNIENL